jgi:hypothetical protein
MEKLTDVKVARTAVPKGDFKIIWDNSTTGFGLKLTPAGRRLFVLQLVYPGHRTQSIRTLGQYPGLSLAEARAKAIAWYGMAKRGVDPTVEQDKAIEAARRAAMLSQERSFGSVAEAYIERGLNGQRWRERTARQIRVELVKVWGERPIAEITRHDVVALIERIVARPAHAYAFNILQITRTMFNWAMERNYGL